jgi:hypothetical protein
MSTEECELPRELFESCEHDVAIDQECLACEPALDVDFYAEDQEEGRA